MALQQPQCTFTDILGGFWVVVLNMFCFHYVFCFQPCGRWTQFDYNIFQLGWFNHQSVYLRNNFQIFFPFKDNQIFFTSEPSINKKSSKSSKSKLNGIWFMAIVSEGKSTHPWEQWKKLFFWYIGNELLPNSIGIIISHDIRIPINQPVYWKVRVFYLCLIYFQRVTITIPLQISSTIWVGVGARVISSVFFSKKNPT